MPVVLICSPSDLSVELGGSAVWRDGMERLFAARQDEALTLLLAARPDLVLLDRDLPEAGSLVAAVRRDPSTRGTSLVVVARGDFEPAEVELLEAGANAILRLPAGPEWDDRLDRMFAVPIRRNARIPVCLEVAGETESGPATVLGTVRNLGARGMLLETTAPLEVGEDVDFSFRLDDGDEPVRGCGRVVRQAAPSRFGVEFYGLEGDGTERVRRFVAAGGVPGGL